MAVRDRFTRLNVRLVAFLVVCAAMMEGWGGQSQAQQCPDCFEQGYRIDLPAVPSNANPTPAVLYSGWRNGRCQDDFVCTGTSEVFLGDIDGGIWEQFCDKEVVAFAGGFAPTPATLTTSSPGSSLTLNAPVDLNVSIWVVGQVVTLVDAIDDASKARTVYASLGSGIEIVDDVKSFPNARLAEIPELESDASCDLSPQLSGMGGPPAGYDEGRINVYYIKKFAEKTGSPAGIDCVYNTPPHQEIILLDGTMMTSPVVLAHELGHALGQLRSVPIPGGKPAAWGHVDDLQLEPYLSTGNLMRSGGAYVGQISLGQIYRMHFDKLSWVWLGQAPGSDYPRECQNSPVQGGPCPPLTIRPSKGWP
jgi:hypothetical protein